MTMRSTTSNGTHAVPSSRWGSVKLRLAAIGAFLIATAVALTVGLTLHAVDTHDEQVALDLSLAHTRKMARLMSARLVSLQLSLRAATQTLDLSRPLDRDTAEAFLKNRPVLMSLLDTMTVVRPDGEVLAFRDGKGPRVPGLNVSDREYFRDTIAQQRPIISQAVVGRLSKEPVIVLTMPVLGPDGRILLVLAGSLRLASRELMPEITATDDADSAMTVIVDKLGRVLSHPDRQWLMRDAAEVPALTGALSQWVAQGRPIEPAGLAERLGDYLVSHAGVPDAEWVVMRSAPLALLLGGGARARQRALAVGAAVALGGGALLLLATFFLLRPLRRIEACTIGWTQGRVPADAAWPRPNNELGQLSRALQQALQARADADSAGRDLLDRLQAVMSHAPVGIAFTRDRKFEAVSAHFTHLLGYPNGALIGQPPRMIYASDEFYDGLGARVGAAFDTNQAFDEEIEFLRRDGARFWGRMQGQPVRWGDAAAGTIWTLDDVTLQRRQRETLTWAGSHDALTHLANRANFEGRLSAHCQDRRRREPVCVLFIDLDRFKAVNDSAGHAAGDAVLVAVARVLEDQVRHADTVARLGGDEFAVLLTACNREGAASVAEKMRAAVEALRVNWAGAALSVGASVGVVELEPSLPDAAAVLAAADAACYAAKHAGRNAVRVHGVVDLQSVG